LVTRTEMNLVTVTNLNLVTRTGFDLVPELATLTFNINPKAGVRGHWPLDSYLHNLLHRPSLPPPMETAANPERLF